MKLSCIKLTELHNLVLRFGESLLPALIVVAGGAAFHVATHDDATRFVLSSRALVVLPSRARGRVSRDGVLFAQLGCVVGLEETFRAPAPVTSAVGA